jgi:hypothetical protein
MSYRVIPPLVLHTVMKYNKNNAMSHLYKNKETHDHLISFFEPYALLLKELAVQNIHKFGRREKSLLLEDITQESLDLLDEYLEAVADNEILRNVFFHLHIEYCNYLDRKLQKHRLVNRSIIRNLEAEFSEDSQVLKHANDEFLYNYFMKFKADIPFEDIEDTVKNLNLK